MLRRLLSGAGVALGLFHVWLFVRQIAAGDLSAEALVKWLAALGLAAALLVLKRRGIPLFRGRKAIAVWTLVALLHAPAVGERLATFDIPAGPAALAEVLASVAPVAGALLLLWLAAAHPPRPRFTPLARLPIARLAHHPAFASFAFSPRPPPVQ